MINKIAIIYEILISRDDRILIEDRIGLSDMIIFRMREKSDRIGREDEIGYLMKRIMKRIGRVKEGSEERTKDIL